MTPRSSTDRVAFAAALAAMAMIAQQVGGKATRDALFLSIYEVERLPNMIIAASLFSLALVGPTSRAMTRFGPGRLIPSLFWASAALLLVEWALSFAAPQAAAVAVYLHIAAFGPVLVSGFWSMVNERFDPRTAKQRISRIAAGATLGGLAGGLVAERVGTGAGILVMFPVLAALHGFCGWRVRALIPAETPPAGAVSREKTPPSAGGDAAGPGARSRPTGLRGLRREPYLRNLALLTLLGTVAAGLIDYAFKTQAAHQFQGPERGEALMRFFAIFYTATGLLTFLVQTLSSRRLLERLGIARTVGILPGTVAAGGLAALFFPGLAAAAAVCGAEAVLRSSVYRSGYELFYTPLPPEQKRSCKTIIDVGFDRAGDTLSGGLVKSLLLLPRTVFFSILLLFAIALALLTSWIAMRLGRGYVRALEKNLLSRAVQLDIGDVHDSTTRTIMMQTMGSIDRGALLRQLEEVDQRHRGRPGSKSEEEESAPTVSIDPGSDLATDAERDAHGDWMAGRGAGPGRAGDGGEVWRPPGGPDLEHRPAIPRSHDPLVEQILALRSGDEERTRQVLRRKQALDPALVPHVIPLLAWDAVCGDAVRALRLVSAKHAGQILDSLLDPAEEFSVRRRIPRVFPAFPTPRAIDGLFHGLEDRRFEVRYQCGLALSQIHRRHPELKMSRERVHEVVLRELKVDRPIWESRRLLDQPDVIEPIDDEPSPLVDEMLRTRSNRSLEHVFTLLSLCLDEQPLRIAYRGLHTDDALLRGTALEYLESVLPSRIREDLWPFLEVSPKRGRQLRPKQEILRDLLRSHESIAINLKALRADLGDPEA